MTAEFAIAMPAVILVLAGFLTAVQAGTSQLRLQDAAAAAARVAARSPNASATAARVAAELMPGASATVWRDDSLLCVGLSAPARVIGELGLLTLTARSCALDGGR